MSIVRPRNALAILLLAVLVGGCGGEPNDLVGLDDLDTPIVNGTIDYGYAPVGVLMTNGGMCTATLVGTRTVLTAAHCVQPGAFHRFFVGNKFWDVTSAERHPSYSPQIVNYDVAIAHLEQTPPVTPAFITTVAPTVGQELTLVGYGATSDAGYGSGKKRVGINRVAKLTSTRIVIAGSSGTDANLCFGDSGGPSFATIDGHDVVVGVHSTISGGCGMQGHDMRVDVFADWIETTGGGDVAKDGVPSPYDDTEPPVVEITAPADGTRLRGPLELTGTVTDNAGVKAVELQLAGKVLETQTEPDFAFTVKLEPGVHKLTVVGRDLVGLEGTATVKVEVLPPLLFGEACTLNEDCATDLCGAVDGEQFCTETCTPDTDGCPDDAECMPAGEGMNVCGPPGSGLQPAAEEGGCAVTPAPAAPPLLLVLPLLGLLAWRRRRG